MQNNKLVYVIDIHGTIVYANDALCQITGLSQQTLQGKKLQELFHPDVPKQIYDEMWLNIKKGFSWHGVFKCHNQQNEYWLDIFITPQYQGGEIVGYQCIGEPAAPQFIKRAQKVYEALNKGDSWTTFEFTRRHKFIFLTLLTIVCQLMIFDYGGWLFSLVTAMAAMAPIMIFWQDIMPIATKARVMQDTFDSISRQVYCGTGTASVFDFNLGMLKAKIRAILERSNDVSVPLTEIVADVEQGMAKSRNSIERQRNELMQISVAMGQMSAASNEIAQSTVSTADDVNATKSQCEQARANIAATTDSIRVLAKEVDEAAASADLLASEAQNIEGLMANIESIADQTNLLALNAAIEAARAGENGRGFAVVAEEVRALSFRTQESSKRIHSSLMAMLNTINTWVGLMAQNKTQADTCVSAAEASDEAIEAVYHRIDQIANLAMQIATAAEEQGAVTTDINRNVQTVSEASESNWQQTEQVAVKMQQLHQCALEIANLSSTFMPAKK